MLEEYIKKAAEHLKAKEAARDEAFSRGRRARVLSKQAIFDLHKNAVDAAETKLDEARSLLQEVENIVDVYPDISGSETIEAAYQEYSEASIIHGLKKTGEFIGPEDIGVGVRDYILGLGDVPGELRREVLDALRVGDLEIAEVRLTQMERIFLTLVSMEEVPLLRGLRRKLDITRGVIERTRGDITSEVGRRRLGDSINKLRKRLK
jgi:translin